MLGFDTSLATTSACVLRDDGIPFTTAPPTEERLLGAPRHSQELLPELDRLLTESGTRWEDVHAVAVGIGPGTFTGLRIGVATARALGQALGVELRPVSSLEALALPVADLPGGRDQPVLGLIDARRGQVFAALYEWTDGAPRPRAAWHPAVFEPERLVESVGALERPPICVGDWAIKSRSDLEGARARVPPAESGLHAVSGLHLCMIAAATEAVVPADVYPEYLRLPDAEITRRRVSGDQDDSQGD